MRTFFLLVAFALLVFTSNAQIKLDTKNLNRLKNTVENANNKKNENNTAANTVSEQPKTSNTTTSSGNTSAGNTSNDVDLGGWSMDELRKISFTNAYFLSGGWIIDAFTPKSKYSDALNVPVVKVVYWSYCYKQPFTLYVFRMSDKGAVGSYNFEAEMSSPGNKGEYTSEMIIVDHDKYILLFSYYSKVDTEMDNYFAETMPELVRRLPNEWR